ncbi:MAG: DNA polymerase subunit beta [Phycisphaerales bacterium]|nr:MAG: DNA polymerase subunit beta [Phycisphaerales bacterium]
MPALPIDHERLAEVCRKWRIAELSLFGSALREDFGADSDVDLLAVFEPAARVSLWDWPQIEDDFAAIFGGRKVDFVERKSLRNPFVRHRVLTTRRVVYAA